MEPQMASALTNAIVHTQHPRNDFRTEEDRRYTQWMVEYAQPFIHPSSLSERIEKVSIEI